MKTKTEKNKEKTNWKQLFHEVDEKSFMYFETELEDNEFCDYLIELYSKGYKLIKQ